MRRLLTGLLVGLVACGAPDVAPADPPSSGTPEDAPPSLASSLSVSIDDSVRLRLDLTNAGATPVVLEFATAQRAEFAVEDTSGQEIWRWSEGQMFAQALGSDTIAAGETRSWDAAWDPAGRDGVFRVIGTLVSTSHPLDLQTEFELPND